MKNHTALRKWGAGDRGSGFKSLRWDMLQVSMGLSFSFLEIRKWICPYGLSWSSFKLQWMLTETKMSGIKHIWLNSWTFWWKNYILTWREGLRSVFHALSAKSRNFSCLPNSFSSTFIYWTWDREFPWLLCIYVKYHSHLLSTKTKTHPVSQLW